MAGKALGPLHGVPVAVKDLLDTSNLRTACGSIVLADYVPQESATAVIRLEQAGAVLIGKLQMTEFAGTAHHPKLEPPRNPYDETCSPGGSSSGSGVAAAAGLCAASLGSDTVASIRNPAAWNGCVGFKPSFGRISRHGVFPLAHSLDHIGPLARSVEDAVLLLEAIAGHDQKDLTSRRDALAIDWRQNVRSAPLRVGYDEAFVTSECHPDVVQVVCEALAVLEADGAEIVQTTIPMTDQSLVHFGNILLAEVGVAHRKLFPSRADDYGPQFRSLLERAQRVTAEDLVYAQQFRMAFCDAIADLFTRIDVLLTPVMPFNAPREGAGMASIEDALSFLRFTYHWNLAGTPALAVPWGLDAQGLPQSVQIIGPAGDDTGVLSVGAALERPLPRPPEQRSF